MPVTARKPAVGISLVAGTLFAAGVGFTCGEGAPQVKTAVDAGDPCAGGHSCSELPECCDPLRPSTRLGEPVCFRDGPPMLTGRSDHSAVNLPDGRIFVMGGVAGYYTESTEFLDPATGTWTPGPPMKTRRMGFRADLLPDGRVLVTGGLTHPTYTEPQYTSLNETYSPLVELFDPATNTWTDGRPMHSPRWLHKSIVFEDGRVLVAGGSSRSTAEVYDSNTDTWTPIPNTVDPFHFRLIGLHRLEGNRALATAFARSGLIDIDSMTWVEGPVRARGTAYGLATGSPGGRHLIYGAEGDRLTEEFTDGGFVLLDAALTEPRWRHTAYPLDPSRDLILGGLAIPGPEGFAQHTTASVELFDAETMTLVPAGRMRAPRYDFALASYGDGGLIVLGGNKNDGWISLPGAKETEIFDPNCPDIGYPP